MTSEVKKTSRRDQSVHCPSGDNWEGIIHDLKLGAKEAAVLKDVVERAVAQIQTHQEKHFSPDERKDLINKMRTLEKVLDNLRYEIDRSHRMMLDYLPNDFLMKLGARSSTFFVKEVLGDNSISPRLDLDIQLQAQEPESVNLAKVEEFSKPILEAIGLKSGPDLFLAYIRDLHQSLKFWRELNGRQSSGRPSLSYRKYLILMLAVRAPDVIGKPAPKTPNGIFAHLCVSVLDACGLSTKGVAKSIPGVIGILSPEVDHKQKVTS